LESKRGSSTQNFAKRLKDEGFTKSEDFVEFKETDEYWETAAAKRQQGQEVYDAWFKANHRKVPEFVDGQYVGERDRPLRHWTHRVPTDRRHINPRHIKGQITPKETFV